LLELTEAVLDIWAKELTLDYINRWIDSMLERIEAVISRKGGVTSGRVEIDIYSVGMVELVG
jgi:hypothetical protein